MSSSLLYRVNEYRSIVFCGPDGSGKTTVSRTLYLYLRLKEINICLHWVRGSHLLASILLRFLSRLNTFKGVCNPYYRVCIPTRLRALWALIEFLSLLPHILFRYVLQRICFVIGDRGVLDSAVWIATTLSWPSFLKTLLGRFLLALASKERIIYLYADLRVLLSRSDVPRNFLSKELAYYSVLSRYYARVAVDSGVNSPTRVVALVLKSVAEEPL